MPIRFRPSAFKHGITESQIQEVLADRLCTRFFELHDDDTGNNQEMAVGYTQASVLLEIGITYFEDHEAVFHAKVATSHYKKLYEES